MPTSTRTHTPDPTPQKAEFRTCCAALILCGLDSKGTYEQWPSTVTEDNQLMWMYVSLIGRQTDQVYYSNIFIPCPQTMNRMIPAYGKYGFRLTIHITNMPFE
jgi:hypothetical protein